MSEWCTEVEVIEEIEGGVGDDPLEGVEPIEPEEPTEPEGSNGESNTLLYGALGLGGLAVAYSMMGDNNGN